MKCHEGYRGCRWSGRRHFRGHFNITSTVAMGGMSWVTWMNWMRIVLLHLLRLRRWEGQAMRYVALMREQDRGHLAHKEIKCKAHWNHYNKIPQDQVFSHSCCKLMVLEMRVHLRLPCVSMRVGTALQYDNRDITSGHVATSTVIFISWSGYCHTNINSHAIGNLLLRNEKFSTTYSWVND